MRVSPRNQQPQHDLLLKARHGCLGGREHDALQHCLAAAQLAGCGVRHGSSCNGDGAVDDSALNVWRRGGSNVDDAMARGPVVEIVRGALANGGVYVGMFDADVGCGKARYVLQSSRRSICGRLWCGDRRSKLARCR